MGSLNEELSRSGCLVGMSLGVVEITNEVRRSSMKVGGPIL